MERAEHRQVGKSIFVDGFGSKHGFNSSITWLRVFAIKYLAMAFKYFKRPLLNLCVLMHKCIFI